jgi:hypothetical protein
MESFNLQDRTRIGAVNRMAEVGRVTPCAPPLVLQEIVVAGVGAQRTARPTFRFMERFDISTCHGLAAVIEFGRDTGDSFRYNSSS